MKKVELAKKLIERNSRLFRCPVCGKEMGIKNSGSLACLNRHSFDLAKQGYINMLLSPIKTNYNKEMLESRNIICKSGFFDPMIFAVSDLILKETLKNNTSKINVLDAGCGEGSHLFRILRNLKNKVKLNFLGVGIDISKEGIRIASRDYPNIIWCVADLSKMPLRNKQFKIVFNILSPANYLEFSRILRSNGKLIKVIPGTKHLTELRDIFFDELDQTYTNDRVIQHFAKNFKIINKQKILYNVILPYENVEHLLKMTPLSWNVENKKIEKAKKAGIKNITVDFDIVVGKKIGPS